MKALAVVILSLVFLASLLLYKAVIALPISEVRRRARGKDDPKTAAIYKMAAYSGSLLVVLWLIGVLSAGGLLIWSVSKAWWVGLIFILLINWFVLSSRLRVVPHGWLWQLAGFLAPLITAILDFLQPLLVHIPKTPSKSHSGIFEREDLLELLDSQRRQVDNRLSKGELDIVKNALTFGDKKVSDVMTPRKASKFVEAGEIVGPTIMDELHATGFIRFPVVKEVPKSGEPKVVGTLYINDILNNLEKGGKVADIMKKDAQFINESHSLRQALDAFLKTHHHLLIVVNNFEEFVGVLTMEDVLEQILGEPIAEEFSRYDDLKAVAGHESHKQDSQQEKTDIE